MFTTKKITFALALLSIAHASSAAEQDRFAAVQISAQQVSGSVYMLTGSGGNIGVTIGADGTLIVDDQYGPLADKIIAAIQALGGNHPKLVLNTHWHGDHTGSNPQMGETGTIIAHKNVRVRLLGQPDYPRSGLPLVTYGETLQVHFNDEEIELIHLPAGHTDGDAAVWFKTSNVIHMGDHFFNQRFPYIDIGSGGSIDGFVANVMRVLPMIPDDIQVIPGHGTLANKQDLSETIATVSSTAKEIRSRLAQGVDTAAIVSWLNDNYASWASGFINAERWVQIVQSDTK